LNPIAVLVPVKSGGTKSRLAGVLSKQERREFSEALIGEVLGALRSAGLLKRTFIVSSDAEVLEQAQAGGAGSIREVEDDGVNAAVLLGVRNLKPSTVIVIPSDLPLIRGADVIRLLQLKTTLDVAMAPSMGFDGTNALAFDPRDALPLSYDDNSFWNHVASCGRKGLSVGVASEQGLMFDVDTPEDLKRLAGVRSERAPVVFARRVTR
jgi:2-phospho-L-lactate/phosphoenolpyruvate guanylyltransferase